MTLDNKTIGELPLDEFVSVIPRIYSRLDASRSIWDVWLHANHHAAGIGEEARKRRPGGKLLEEIADTAMWLFTFVGKLQAPLGDPKPGERPEESLIRVSSSYSDLLWNKYPNMCPVCYWRRTQGERTRESSGVFAGPCDCLLADVESRDQTQKRQHVNAIREYAADKVSEKPTSVDKWQDMFARIFAANLRHLDLASIAFHLLEEMGEVSDAMVRMYTYDGRKPVEPNWSQVWLEEEIADVTSWLFALIESLKLIIDTVDEYEKWRFGEAYTVRDRILLSTVLWRRYGADSLRSLFCPHCRRTPCECSVLLPPEGITIDTIVKAYRGGGG